MNENRLYSYDEIRPFQAPYYHAHVLRVVDGDTYDLMTDIGFDTFRRLRVRLLDANTPEPRGESKEEGKRVSRVVSERLKPSPRLRIPLGTRLVIQSRKGGVKGSLSRWLADVYYQTEGGWRRLSAQLLAEGNAEVYQRRRRSSKPA